jgi:recombination protein RecA
MAAKKTANTSEVSEDAVNKFEKTVLKQRMKALGISDKCLTDGDTEPVSFIPTGVFEVDSILGEGAGIPEGTLIEFCGESQSGKTWLLYKLIAEAQKRGKKCAFFNVENSYYKNRAISCGVDVKALSLIQNVGSAEKNGELIKAMVESGHYGVIGIDSITALTPQDELTKTMEQVQTIGVHARFVKRLTKDLVARTAASGTICVLINQLYMGAGKMPGTMSLNASGGNAMNYFTHMRLWINKVGGAAGKVTKKDDEGKDTIIGGKSKVLVMKTRYGTPGVTSEFKIMFTDDEEANMVDEFIYRSKSKPGEFIKESRKKFSYVVEETGEVLESKDAIEFINMLREAPAPAKRTRGDDSTTAFEFICGRLKIVGKPLDDLIKALDNPKPVSDDDDDDQDSDDAGLSFDDVAAMMIGDE